MDLVLEVPLYNRGGRKEEEEGKEEEGQEKEGLEVGEVGKAGERQRKERDKMTHAPFGLLPCAARTTHSLNKEENEKKDGREQKEGGG